MKNEITNLVDNVKRQSKAVFVVYFVLLCLFSFGIWNNYQKIMKVIEIAGDYEFPKESSGEVVMLTTIQLTIPIMVSFSLMVIQGLAIMYMTIKLIEYHINDDRKLLLALADKIQEMEKTNKAASPDPEPQGGSVR